MDDVQEKINTLDRLLRAAHWDAASSKQADLLIEKLEQQVGEHDERVKRLGAALQQRNKALQSGSPSAAANNRTTSVMPMPEPDQANSGLASTQASSSAIANVSGEDRAAQSDQPRLDVMDARPAAGVASTAEERDAARPPTRVVEEISSEITPALVEQAETEQATSIEAEAIKEPGAFGEAIQALVAEGRFVLRRKLQTGQYSTGYEASEPAGGGRVAIKLPAQEAWDSRFEECAQAIMDEDDLLVAITSVLASTSSKLRAQPVAHLASGHVSVPSWPKQIPWVAQTFAHGQRVRDLIPMRDAREPEGLRILLQVTGMVRDLYASDFAHRDLKQDCLFWDPNTKQVEVIDWNRAIRNPTANDKELEFAALQRLTSAVLLGPLFRWSAADSYHRDLLLAFPGTPLSRGSRLLLFRLLDPAHLQPIRDVDELDMALRELLAWWDQPLQERPTYAELSPQPLSSTLNRLSIEAQRPNAESPIAAHSIDWQIEAFRAAQADIQKRIRLWLANREALRTAARRIEEVWPWFPDVWPINLLVPLSRAWFKHLPRERDDLLVSLAGHMAANQWDEVAKRVRQFITALPNQSPTQLLSLLQETQKTALAYQALDQLEQQLRSAPDYAAALSTTAQLREALSLDPRVARLARQVDAATEQAAKSAQLLTEVEQLRAQQLDSCGQRRLLQVLDDLRVLGLNDARYNEQRRKVALIDDVRQAIDRAQGALDQGEEDPALRTLEPWRNHAELPIAVPDLARRVEMLAAKIETRTAQKQLDAVFAEVRQVLVDGDLGAAIGMARQAQSLAEQAPSRLSERSHGEIDRLSRGLSEIASLWQTLEQHGNQESVERLNTTELPVVALPLGRALNELVDRRSVMNHVSDLDSAISACAAVTAPLPDSDTFAGLAPLHAQLRTAALLRLEQALRKMLEQSEELSGEHLRRSKSALKQLRNGFGERAELDTLEHLIDLRGVEQFSMIAAQINTAINEVKETVTPLTTQVQKLKETVTPLTGLANYPELATKVDVANITTSLNSILKALPAMSARPPEQKIPAVESQDAALEMTGSGVQSQRLERSAASRTGVFSRIIGTAGDQSDKSKTAPPSDEAASQVLPIWRDPQMRPWLAIAAMVLVVLIGTGVFLARGRFQTGSSRTPTTAAPTAAVESTSEAFGGAVAPNTLEPSATAARPTAKPTAEGAEPAASPIPVDAPASASLSSTITLRAPGIDSVRQLNAQIMTGTVALSTTSRVSDSVQLTLSENLFAQVTSAFSIPVQITLVPGDGFSKATISINETVVTVRGVGKGGPNEVYSDATVKGAYLWKEWQGRNPAADRMKPTGKENISASYVLLEDGDQVRILGGRGDLYRVRVESNHADGTNATGKEGWVRKDLIHGQ